MSEPLSERENVMRTKKLIERWENVERVLRNLTPHQRRKHWDMSGYLYDTSCGTIGCAAGHCAFDPWFRRRGYAAKRVKSAYGDAYEWVSTKDLHDYFGYAGSSSIFHNFQPRPVGQVIREVRAHIKSLRAQLPKEKRS